MKEWLKKLKPKDQESGKREYQLFSTEGKMPLANDSDLVPTHPRSQAIFDAVARANEVSIVDDQKLDPNTRPTLPNNPESQRLYDKVAGTIDIDPPKEK